MQQHGNKYFARNSPSPPPPNPRGGLNWSKFNFFKNMFVLYFKGARALRGYFGPRMRPKNENCLSQESSY